MASQQPTQSQCDPALIWYDCYYSISNAADTKDYATTELLCNDMDEDAHWHGHHLKVFATIMAEKVSKYAAMVRGEEQVVADSLYDDFAVLAMDGKTEKRTGRRDLKKSGFPLTRSMNPAAVPDDEVEYARSTVTEFENESQLDGVFDDENAGYHDFGAAYERQSQRNPGPAEWERDGFDPSVTLSFLWEQEDEEPAIPPPFERQAENQMQGRSSEEEADSPLIDESQSDPEPEPSDLDDEELELVPNTPVAEPGRDLTRAAWNASLNRHHHKRRAARLPVTESSAERILRRLENIRTRLENGRTALERMGLEDSQPDSELRWQENIRGRLENVTTALERMCLEDIQFDGSSPRENQEHAPGLSAESTSTEIVEALLPIRPRPVEFPRRTESARRADDAAVGMYSHYQQARELGYCLRVV